MSYPGAAQPPTMYQSPKKSAPLVPIILAILALLIVLAVVGGIHAFRTVQADSAEAIAAGNSFVDNMGQHHYGAAHALLTAQGQAKTPAGDLKDIEVLTEKHHGAFVNHGQPQWNVQSWNGQTTVRLAYPAQFTKSDSTISMTLIKTDGGWHVYEVHYEF